MRFLTRREALLAGATISVLLAGCTGDDDNANGNGSGNGNENGNGNGSVTVTDVETLDVGASLGRPASAGHDKEAPGVVYRYDSDELGGPDADVLHGSDADVGGFVEDTKFETSVLLQVGSVGPSTCWETVGVSDLAVEDGALTGEAKATHTGAEGCDDAITYPWALVRVVFDGTPPEDVELRITDGWGDVATVSPTSIGRIDPADLDGHVSPDGDPRTLEGALACDREGFERHPQFVEEDALELGENGRDDDEVFALRADNTQYALGETVHISMTNLTVEEQTTGNRHKYNLQLLTEEGWQDVRGSTEMEFFGYTDEGVVHAPGEGFEWALGLTDEGVVDGHFHDDLVVCPSLQPGRYRFLYWEPAVAVEFDVEE